jgi:uncharacterized delta-60 repeat protein
MKNLNDVILLVTLTSLIVASYGKSQTTPDSKTFYHHSGLHSLSENVSVAWTRHYSSGLVPNEDWAVAIKTDANGNVYVTGVSAGIGTSYDYVTIKYDSNGVQQWQARYNRPDNGQDIAQDLAIDDFGNVYVTGSWGSTNTKLALDDSGNVYVTGSGSYHTVKYNSNGIQQWAVNYEGGGFGTGSDYFTIKYNSDGKLQWQVRYNHSQDYISEIAVDDAGNIYVTGTFEGSVYGYATIKYNRNGIEQWVETYNDAAKILKNTAALVLDDSANVYIAGTSEGPGRLYNDYVTIKYNTNGVLQWMKRYDKNTNDRATAMAIDRFGYVYVTGIGDYQNYTTIKYNSDGVEQWVAHYNCGDTSEPLAIVADPSGNIYVTGRSQSLHGSLYSWDYATVKYDSKGVQQWIVRYDGPGQYQDEARAITVDNSGNILVTGYSTSLGADMDYLTFKYNQSGALLWETRFDGPDKSADRPAALAVDALENIYVIGSSQNSDGGTDYATVKYDRDGSEQWVARQNGVNASYSQVTAAIAVTDPDYVYMTGPQDFGEPGDLNVNFATIKYNSQGILSKMFRYDDANGGSDFPSDIALDQFGNVYVTGTSWILGAVDYQNENVTIKCNSDLEELWTVQQSFGDGNAVALAIDASENVYVTGNKGGLGTEQDFVTFKYNAEGVLQWTARYNDRVDGDDKPVAIAIDDSGNVCVTGRSQNSGAIQYYDYLTIKYSTNGTEQWLSRYGGPAENSGDNLVSALVIDKLGNIYVTGASTGADGTYDFCTIKYNTSGKQQWAARYNGPRNANDQATGICLDSSANVYVTGWSGSSGDSLDYLTIKYDSSGVQQWAAQYNGPLDAEDKPVAIAIDKSGNIIVTGTSQIDENMIYTTIKYNQSTVSVDERDLKHPGIYYLSQNYPNPFNSETNIRYALPRPSDVTLKVFNITGQEVACLVNEQKSAGEYQVLWNPVNLSSGIYFYQLKVATLSVGVKGGFEATNKLVIMK